MVTDCDVGEARGRVYKARVAACSINMSKNSQKSPLKTTENPRSAGLIFDHSEISALDSETGFVISGENWV